MAMQRGQGRWGSFNENIEKLLQYLMQMNLMQKRHGFEMTQIGERQAGYERLESQRAKSQVDEIMLRFSNEIAKLPEIDNLVVRLRKAKTEGQDTTALEKQLEQSSMNLAEFYLGRATGKRATMPEVQNALRYIGSAAVQKLVPELALEREKIGVRREEIGLGREALGVRREELGVRVMEAMGETKKEKVKFWKDFIQENINYLEMQGVKRTDVGSDIMALFRSGKELAPLSAEHHGQALQYLTQIMARLGQDKLPTQGEINFMTKVRNTFEIEKEGGLPSPVTGEMPSEVTARDEALRARMREQIINYIMTTYGLSQEEAQRYAESLMAGIK